MLRPIRHPDGFPASRLLLVIEVNYLVSPKRLCGPWKWPLSCGISCGCGLFMLGVMWIVMDVASKCAGKSRECGHRLVVKVGNLPMYYPLCHVWFQGCLRYLLYVLWTLGSVTCVVPEVWGVQEVARRRLHPWIHFAFPSSVCGHLNWRLRDQWVLGRCWTTSCLLSPVLNTDYSNQTWNHWSHSLGLVHLQDPLEGAIIQDTLVHCEICYILPGFLCVFVCVWERENGLLRVRPNGRHADNSRSQVSYYLISFSALGKTMVRKVVWP